MRSFSKVNRPGLISATAQGVRWSKSKLRFSLQPLSHLTISLVKGKSSWRIVGAVHRENYVRRFKKEPELLLIVARIFSLVRRMIRGEESNERLFADLEHQLLFLEHTAAPDMIPEHKQAIEYLMVITLLQHLGYIGQHGRAQHFTQKTLTKELLTEIVAARHALVAEINQALKESQL